MAALTQDDVRTLAARRSSAPITSCYLDVDGARRLRHQDVVHHLELLLKDARHDANGDSSVRGDLQRIEDHVKGGFDRSHVRGLAMFSSSAARFWQALALPVPVRDQLVVNTSPAVRQLEVVLDEYERFAVLLADRQRARVLVLDLGELVERTSVRDELPRGDDDDHSIQKDKVRDHVAAHAHQHLRHAADTTFEVFKESGFDHLIVGAPDETAAELEAQLHPYLKERVAARCRLPVGASDDEIRTAALAVERQVEQRKEAALVDRLREAVGAGRRGVAGLDPTLAALAERRVDILLVSEGYTAPGWRCGKCDHVARKGRTCPVCSEPMHQVADVVEEAVEEALAQACKVETCVGNADLDVLGRIGALLRY